MTSNDNELSAFRKACEFKFDRNHLNEMIRSLGTAPIGDAVAAVNKAEQDLKNEGVPLLVRGRGGRTPKRVCLGTSGSPWSNPGKPKIGSSRVTRLASACGCAERITTWSTGGNAYCPYFPVPPVIRAGEILAAQIAKAA